MFNGALLRVRPDVQMGAKRKVGGYFTHACAQLGQLVLPNDDGPTSKVGGSIFTVQRACNNSGATPSHLR